jgi:hypothetical protein
MNNACGGSLQGVHGFNPAPPDFRQEAATEEDVMAATTIEVNIAELDKLKKALGATSRNEVIRRALGLLALAVEKQDGNNMISIGQGSKATVVLLR